MHWLKTLPRSLKAILSLSVAIQLLYAFSAKSYLLQRLIADDAFYYFKIALNFHTRHNFTFDGLHLTNGFHPLYQYWVTALSWLTQDPIALIRVVLIGAIALHLVASLLLYAVSQRLFSKRGALFLVALWALSPAFIRINLLGLENSLLAVFLLTSFSLFLRLRTKGSATTPRDFLLLGIAFGFGFLARIDEIFWIIIATIWLARPLLAGGVKPALKKITAYLIPQIIIVLPFLSYNLLTFQHLFPISGAVKRYQMVSWLATHGWSILSPDFLWRAGTTGLAQVGQWLGYITAPFWALPIQLRLWNREFDEATIATQKTQIALGLGLLAVIIFGLFLWRQRLSWQRYVGAVRALPTAQPFGSLTPFLLFTFVHLVSYLLFFYTQIGYADKWYFIPEYLATLLLVVVVIDRLLLRSPRWLGGLTVSAISLTVVFFAVHFSNASSPLRSSYRSGTVTETKITATAWLNEFLPPDARVGSWNAGLVGYLAQRPVIHLEGLVNNYEYLEQFLRPKALSAYLQRENITYLADYEGGPDDILTSFYGVPIDALEQVYRSEGGTTSFYIFRIRHDITDALMQ